MSALVKNEIFRLFLNTLPPDDKYSRRNMQYSGNNFKRFYLKNETHLDNFLLKFWNVHEILHILKKKKSILA